MAMLAAANLDPAANERPERLDPECKRRSENPSVKQPSWSVAPE